MVISGVALIWSVASTGEAGMGLHDYEMIGGTVGLVLGCLMVIPALLALVGRLGAHLPLSLRLAARDTGRQRGRSTPAVAAIMAAVAALTALSIGSASSIRRAEETYQPQGPMGAGSIVLNSDDSDERSVRAVIDRFAPQLTVDPLGYVSNNPMTFDARAAAQAPGGRMVSWVRLMPPGCTEAQILAVQEPNGGVPTCDRQSIGGGMLQVGGLPTLSARLSLSKSQRAVLESGGIVVTDPRLVREGKVTSVGGTITQDQSGMVTGAALTQRTQLPAVVVDLLIWKKAFPGRPSGVWILPDTATRLGWPVRIERFSLTSPTGSISAAEERAVGDRLGDGYILHVERGYQNESWLILLILFSVTGLLVLIASLISTALSLAEGQNDMATLAAVGATRRTRRGMAACQAFVVAACGCLLGVGVGMIPGIASTWPLTVLTLSATRHTGPVIEIPWLPLLCLLIVVPLLAGAFAWLAVRRHPRMTRRLA